MKQTRSPRPVPSLRIPARIEEEEREVKKTVLPNGVRVVTEEMPHVRSVAAGVWVDRGSRHEDPAENGITHFTEHMVFKGTENRTAEQIACEVDALGGYLDAFTTKENVAFTVKVLDEHLDQALDIVGDLVLRPIFNGPDIAKEKSVVLEELKMDEDNPDYLIHEVFLSNFWKGHPLGRPIIGTKGTIRRFRRDRLVDFFSRTFQPRNLMVSAAGRLEHDRIAEWADRAFGRLKPGPASVRQPPPKAQARIAMRNKPALEQVQLCLGVETYAMTDPRRFAGYVLSVVLGGGVSSRLFLKIREQAGLAYSVYSDLSLYSDAGHLTVSAGTSAAAARQVMAYALAEFRNLKDSLVSDAELRRAKDHLKGSLMLSLESTSSRMSNLARQERYFGRAASLDEVTQAIEAVTAENLRQTAREWFASDRLAVALVGNLDGFKLSRKDLVC